MVLRIATFLCLVALVASQEPTVDVPTDPPTTEPPTTPMATTPMATTPMATDGPTTDMPEEMVPDLDYRYLQSQAAMMRASHFYCLDVNETTFPNDTRNPDGTIERRRWALFLQYPILNYLDALGKERILNITAQLVQIGAPAGSPLNAFTQADFCIADIVQYGVSTYQESILINFYFQGDIVVNEDNENGVDIEAFNTAFYNGYMNEVSNQNSELIEVFLGRYAYIINLFGSQASGFVPSTASEDPTQRAVFLGHYIGNTDIETARAGMRQSFAENPDPLNFGLEAGDIIFAVFGSLFLVIVGGLTVLGFCIHPFFLA